MTKQQITKALAARCFYGVQINAKGHIWAQDSPYTFVRWIVEYGKLLPCDMKVFRVDTVESYRGEADLSLGIIPRAAFPFFFHGYSLN